VLLDGFNGVPGYANIEVALDIDMAASMAPGLASIIIYEGFITDSILNRMATDNLARQLSASWTYPIDATTEQIFQQFAAQGQSFFNASGDYDAWVGGVSTPSDDPYITIVGGTTLTTSGPGGNWVSEKVWNWDNGIGSGGGISITYPIPNWQKGVNMTLNHGSTTMRNIPDVALTADNVFVIADEGSSGAVGGTSAATPLWAAFIALVNQQAAANGLPSAGFINPAIYSLGLGAGYTSEFHDITLGDNTSAYSPTDFFAVPGYDLCTGWGSPRPALINALAPPDALQITPAAGFIVSGGAGGPFTATSQTYTLTNAGVAPLNWAVGCNAPWISVSPGSGTLTPGGPSTSVPVTFNAATSNLLVGVHSATVWFTNLTDSVKQTRTVTLTLIKPPTITLEPTNLTLLGGATAIFNVAATGGLPLSYQWQRNGTNLTDGGNVSGSGTPTLTVSNVSVADAGSYAGIVSNAAGVASSTSAFLSIIFSAPVIVQQPASQAVMFGSDVTLSAHALGNAPLSYRWKANGTNLNDLGNVAGSGTPSLTLHNVSGADLRTYTVVVTNNLGAATSTGAVLTVYAQSTQNLVQNGGFETGDFTAWTGSGNFTLTSVSGDASYALNGAYGALMGPAGSLGYLFQDVPTSPGGTYALSLWVDSPDGLDPNEFQVYWDGNLLFDQTNMPAFGWTNLQFTVTANGSSTGLEFGFQDDASFLGLDDISVHPLLDPNGAPVIVTQPPDRAVAVEGAAATLTLSVAGQSPLSYRWKFNGADVPNGTNATLSLTGLTTNQTGVYYVVVTNLLGSATSSNTTLTVLHGTASVLTFDDLSGSTGESVPDGYGDLHWNNFYVLDAVNDAPPHSGYRAGMVSPNNVVYDGYGQPAWLSGDRPFSLLSAYATAAWNDNLRFQVKGFAGSALVYQQTFTLSATTPTLINFGCVGVTSIEFSGSGGTAHPGYSGPGTHFVLDNVSVVSTPGPPQRTLYSFNGPDGGLPYGPLMQASDGSFYGTTAYGGAYGYGTIFRMTTNGLSTLVSFNYTNGSYPVGGIMQSTDGNFYGTTYNGGGYGAGTVFRITTDGTLTVLASLGAPGIGGAPYAGLVQGMDGNLYGTTANGGTNGYGTVFRITTNGALTSLTSFNYSNGAYPYGGLVQMPDGKLYGTTYGGGINGYGTVFRITTNGTVTSLVSFNQTGNGAYPYAGLLQGAGGILYGTTGYGGTNGYGTVFQFTTNSVLTTLAAFTTQYGAYSGLSQGPDGSLYGTTEYGGRYNLGTLYVLSTNGALSTLRSFGGTNGSLPTAAPVFGNDGNLYGTAEYGGAGYDGRSSSGDGTVFRVELTPPATVAPIVVTQPPSRTVPLNGAATFTVQADSSAPLGFFWSRNGTLIPGATQATYTTNNVQLADSGAQFSCLISNGLGSALSSNAVLTVLSGNASGPVYAFTGMDGSYPQGALVLGTDGNFYGTTAFGGSNGFGTVFRLTTNNVLTTLGIFNQTNGLNPAASLVQGTDGKFYGTTPYGGLYGAGTAFSVTTNGLLTTLVSFNYSGSSPYSPQGSLVQGADGNFYGTTAYGGLNYYGTVFRMTTNGVVTTLASFDGSSGGGYPGAGLAWGPDGKLYGTTTEGGLYSDGTVFRVTTNGVLATLASFGNLNGYSPLGSLVLGLDGNLYGTTVYGGSNYDGTFFQVTTNGVLTTLASFDYLNGYQPEGTLAQGSDGNFYGTTTWGGAYGMGGAFRATPAGTITGLFSFTGTNGAYPYAGLVQGNDTNFYAVTSSGGIGFDGYSSSGDGVVSRLALPLLNGPPGLDAQPANQTVAVGGTATFSVSAHGSNPLHYFWRRNGVTIPGATQSTYSTNNVQLSDSGAQFSCLVSNVLATTLSSNGVLTVTTQPSDYFTEIFTGNIASLSYSTLTFTPNGGANTYGVCVQPATHFPTDPTGGTVLLMGDDTYSQITLSGGNTVAIYGTRTNVIFVGSNGYLTMRSGDATFGYNYSTHFSLPRVSALFSDLYPPYGGTISWKQLGDRLAVTFQSVPAISSSTNTNSFQFELFFDGRIRVTYLALSQSSALVGLSAGTGMPLNFVASDFSSYSSCPPLLMPGSLVHFPNGQFQFGLSGGAGSEYDILVSSNLLNWSVASTLELTNGSGIFLDTNTTFPRRFYRVRLSQ
jgi:uncharacterized repeat protein (TIGR03803 family)